MLFSIDNSIQRGFPLVNLLKIALTKDKTPHKQVLPIFEHSITFKIILLYVALPDYFPYATVVLLKALSLMAFDVSLQNFLLFFSLFILVPTHTQAVKGTSI